MIKRRLFIFTAAIILALAAACGETGPMPANGNETGKGTGIAAVTGTGSGDAKEDEDAGISPEASEHTASGTADPDSAGAAASYGDVSGGLTEVIMQSADVDLDGDGTSEQVKALQIQSGPEQGRDGKLDGILSIKSGDVEKRITFGTKYEGLTGLLTSMEFEDLDGDGAADVFIIVPENGASYSISSYFIYSHKKNKSCSFTSDAGLADFIAGFTFKNAGGNKLSINNGLYDFTADLAIDFPSGTEQPGESMDEYEQSAWIDPVPVDISDSSRLALVTGKDGEPEIKVPMPIFGLAAVDMIGELDLYYSVDSSFEPVLKRFEVMDLNGGEAVKIGGREVNSGK